MKKITLSLVLACISLLAFGQQDLLDAEKLRFEVTVNKDTKKLASLLSDDLIYTHSSGLVDGKEKIIASVAAGTYKSIEVLEQTPITWDNTGIISGKARIVVSNAEGERTIVLKYTDVYRKENGTWKLVAWQSLLVNQDGK